jgi:hypothetical protein
MMSDSIPTIKELVEKRGRALPGRELETMETLYRIREKEVIDVIDWPRVFVLLPRECHVLLIAPQHQSPDYTDYSIQGADQFFAFADPLVTVNYLRDANASRANVEGALGDFNPKLVVHLDHGGNNAVYGEAAGNVPQAVIDTTNSNLLRWRVMSTVSCLSASGLGPDAVAKGCSCYVGYNDLHWIVTSTHNAFWNCANMVHRMLILGYTAQTGFDAAISTYNSNIAAFSASGDVFTATHLTMDRDRLTLLGNGKATTCPKKFFVPQLREYLELERIPEPIWPPEVFEFMEREIIEYPGR